MLRTIVFFALSGAAAFAQTPTVTGVVNAATYSTTLCPGLLAIVYGTNFGGNPANAIVNVGGQAAYVFNGTGDFSPTYMLIEIPFGISTGPASVTVTISGAASQAFNVTLSATSPGIPTSNGSGSGLAVVLTPAGAAVTYANPAHPNDVLTMYAYGLGQTNPASVTGKPSTGANPTALTPSLTIGTASAKIITSTTVPGYIGLYQINFMVPSTGAQGTQPIVLSIGGQSSPTAATLAVVGTTYLENTGSFASPGTIAPGSIATLFANGLGTTTDALSGLFPSTKSEGIQVTFNGEASSIFHIVASSAYPQQQLDLYVPNDLPTSGTVNVQLTTSSTIYPNYTLNMVPASPGLFRFTDSKANQQFAIAQFANTAWVVLPVAATANIGLPACTASTSALAECGQPANIGDTLVVYLTGLGLATVNGSAAGATLPAGQNPPVSGNPLYETPTLPAVTIGGVPATVSFSGLVPGYAGEYQIDVTVPPGVPSGDSVPMKVTMMGASDTANISIQPSRIAPPN